MAAFGGVFGFGLYLLSTTVDTTHRLGFGGTKVLHVIRKSISSLLFFKSILRYLFVLLFL